MKSIYQLIFKTHVKNKFLQMNYKLAELFPTLTHVFASGVILCLILKHSFKQPTVSSLELDSSSTSGTTAISDGMELFVAIKTAIPFGGFVMIC